MLELDGIDSFYGEAHILHGVSLKVAKGEVVALVGRNGAGKTTTLKSAMGLVRPRSGRVTFAGQDITGMAPWRGARLGLGYVPEERRIFKDLTVAENLEVGRKAGPGGAEGWSAERLYALFPNLAERRGQKGGRLSGGEQQMLTLARTLMGNPSMLLLDEPSEGIAPVIVEAMAEALLTLKRAGLAVLLSEQNLGFARMIADRVVLLETGTVRFDGDFAAIEADPAILARYLAV
ncbi:ABC transporter ATP-binding protein [Aurantimonas endophytica]|uniref:Branched-chain amino acid transport system ATP-binding protein n=1 Tax=Aurantimonas endophytica TaxID=1522175 RepID=A0A7W6HF71_9HYPH|nr:ABC transporter ATP-binding protein [Aurantimonas endophytica]MBB4004131.1 branched-chain amino acid transport system ATP-binding protein [Aurantimonas endophytica]MCO6404975.1 ATP-binding cassette domain-containing protein [Aurantimonas endophytica]